MSEKVNFVKGQIKSFLKEDKKELFNKMKENIDVKNNWENFEDSFIVLLTNYGNNPTSDNRKKIDELLETNYSNSLFREDALDEILNGLNIIPEKGTNSFQIGNSNNDSNMRSLYHRIGMRYIGDIFEEIDEKYKNMQENGEKISVDEFLPKNIIEKQKAMEQINREFYELVSKLNEKQKDMEEQNNNNMEKMSPEIKSMYEKMINKEMKEEDFETFREKIEEELSNNSENTEENNILRSLSDHIDIKQKLMIVELIKKQLEDLKKIYGDSKDNSNEKKVTARNIAKRKIEMLGEIGLSDIIEQGANQSTEILNKADITLLEKTRSLGNDKIQELVNDEQK